jgi:hypothetical protein
MYTNWRRVWSRISDDSAMQDVMMETRDLRISILHAAVS